MSNAKGFPFVYFESKDRRRNLKGFIEVERFELLKLSATEFHNKNKIIAYVFLIRSNSILLSFALALPIVKERL